MNVDKIPQLSKGDKAITIYSLPSAAARNRNSASVCKRSESGRSKFWLVNGAAATRRVLQDCVSFRSALPVPQLPPAFKTFELMDPPDHTRFRRFLSDEFTAQRTAQRRSSLKNLVDGLLEDISRFRQPVDLMEKLAKPTSYGVMRSLLGLGERDQILLDGWSDVLSDRDTTHASKITCFEELMSYSDNLVIRKRASPGKDLTTKLLSSGLTDQEIASTVTTLILAGYEAMVSTVGMSVLTFLLAPKQLSELRANPCLIPGAIQELLRFLSTVQLPLARIAAADVDIDGCAVKSGDVVLVSLAAANWDKKEFSQPSTFDIRRSPNRHLAFGYGIHNCIGRLLAQLVLEIVLEGLFSRFSHLSLAVGEDISETGLLFRSIAVLPVLCLR